MDAVITWVDGSDAVHRAKRAAHGGASAHPEAARSTRFASSGELRFAVLSLLRFCPFVRRIQVVTDAQHPEPIDDLLRDPVHGARIRVVDHRTIYAGHEDLLPVFSSRSIETMIHRIPGLAERFLYLNDDMFIGRPMREDDYFEDGRPILRGRLKPLPGSFARRVRAWLRPKRPGYAAAQGAAARLLGRTDYLMLEHQPQPMRRDTLARYYADKMDALRAQAGHKFRSANQISPLGLNCHLELAAGARTAPPLDLGYVRPGRPTGEALRRVMERLQDDAFASFCVQSLDMMSDPDRGMVLEGLRRRYEG